jgi:hypothetical protein
MRFTPLSINFSRGSKFSAVPTTVHLIDDGAHGRNTKNIEFLVAVTSVKHGMLGNCRYTKNECASCGCCCCYSRR